MREVHDVDVARVLRTPRSRLLGAVLRVRALLRPEQQIALTTVAPRRARPASALPTPIDATVAGGGAVAMSIVMWLCDRLSL